MPATSAAVKPAGKSAENQCRSGGQEELLPPPREEPKNQLVSRGTAWLYGATPLIILEVPQLSGAATENKVGPSFRVQTYSYVLRSKSIRVQRIVALLQPNYCMMLVT